MALNRVLDAVVLLVAVAGAASAGRALDRVAGAVTTRRRLAVPVAGDGPRALVRPGLPGVRPSTGSWVRRVARSGELHLPGVSRTFVGVARRWSAARMRCSRSAASAQLPLLVDRVVWSLRSGSSVPQALCDATRDLPEPLASELAPVGRALEGGAGFAEALARWSPPEGDPSGDAADRRRLQPEALVAATLRLASDSGGSAVPALDGVAATLRDRAALDREVRALSSQARASAAVVAAAPVLFGAVVAGMDAEVASFVLGDALGRLCLLAGVLLDAAGAAWMHRITRSATV